MTTQSQPKSTDAVLGGNPQPGQYSAVLGGTAELVSALSRSTRRLNSSKGDTIDTPLTDNHALEVCKELTKNKFAQDLYKKSQEKTLSESQLVWVHKLAVESLQDKVLPRQTIECNAMSTIVEILKNANKNLKSPKIRLIEADSRQEILLYLASQNSKHSGSIQIKHNTTGYGGDWYGRIESLSPNSAQLVKARNCPDWVELLMSKFATAPAQTAAEYGKLTGQCCFCGKGLNDTRSTEMGYGPVCAKTYRLPWGEKKC